MIFQLIREWFFHSLKKTPAIRIAILLLFATGLFLSAGSLNYYFSTAVRVNGFVSVYTDNHHLKLSTTEVNISNVTPSDGKRIQAVWNDLSASKEFRAFNALTGHTFLVLNFKGSDRLVRGYTDGTPQKGIKFYQDDGSLTYTCDVNSLQVSSNFFSSLNITVSDGTDLTNCDTTFIKGKVYPAVLGADFKGYYNIGDHFEANPFLQLSGFTVPFEVVGFAKKNDAVIPFNGDPDDGQKLLYLDNLIITPLFHFSDTVFSDPELSEPASVYSAISFSGNIVCTTLGQAQISKKLKDLYKKNGFTDLHISEVMTVSPIFQADIDQYFSIMFASSLTILISAVVCLSVNMINQLLAHLKTFAIHLISGGTLTDIRRLMTGEVAVLILISNLLAISALVLFGKVFSYSQSQIYSVDFGGIGLVPIIGILLIDLAVLLVSMAIPIYRLHHIEFDSLLRGRE